MPEWLRLVVRRILDLQLCLPSVYKSFGIGFSCSGKVMEISYMQSKREPPSSLCCSAGYSGLLDIAPFRLGPDPLTILASVVRHLGNQCQRQVSFHNCRPPSTQHINLISM